MGAQWKQAGREANAQKKGQLVNKLVREIMVAAKLGGADPETNPRLAAAVEKARKASVYRDTIERAIKKGSGQTDDKVVIEQVTFEGFAPHKVPVVVECLTDNRNRTAPEIRTIFKAGSLGQPGSVGFSSIATASSKPPIPIPAAMLRATPLKPERRKSNRSKRKKFPKARKAPGF